jgi:hypothetical protein
VPEIGFIRRHFPDLEVFGGPPHQRDEVTGVVGGPTAYGQARPSLLKEFERADRESPWPEYAEK